MPLPIITFGLKGTFSGVAATCWARAPSFHFICTLPGEADVVTAPVLRARDWGLERVPFAQGHASSQQWSWAALSYLCFV